jgi:thiosulfate/3-mercaptopyruvate sulfurtransferase
MENRAIVLRKFNNVKMLTLDSPLVSVQWLKNHLDSKDLILLDATINKTLEKDSERIPTARFFDIKQKFSEVSARFPSTLPSTGQFQKEALALGVRNDSAIVVYDDKGIYSSARAWWLFKVFGFHNVAVLDGGLPEWNTQNFEVDVYTDEVYQEGDFETELHPDFMTDFEGVNRYSQDSEYLILDARSKVRFNCEVDEPRAGLRRGSIPNSKNLPFTDLFNTNTFKSKAELSTIFNTLVEAEATKMVFSCGSGITACILALGATLCNYKNLIVYDGSWTEYGTLTNK